MTSGKRAASWACQTMASVEGSSPERAPRYDLRMLDEAALLAAIAAAPDDDRPRLIYADWLLERGEARGELIQIQIALARGGGAVDGEALRARERALLEAHQERWLGTPWDARITWLFDRGLPTGRFGHAGLFVERGREGSFSCQRYFADGTAIFVSIGAAPTEETLRQVARWFAHGYEQGGQYAVTFAPGAPPAVRATSTSRYGSVDFTGVLRGATLAYDWHSHINGADGAVRLEVALVDGVDSR